MTCEWPGLWIVIYQTLLYDKAEREFWCKKCNLDIGIVEERVEHEETDRGGRESKSIIIIIANPRRG